MKSLLVCVCTCLAMTSHAALVRADGHGTWQSVATGCSWTTNVGSFATGGGKLTTSSGGNVTLFCPVQNLGDSCDGAGGVNVLQLLSAGSSTTFGAVHPFLIKIGSLGTETIVANPAGTGVTSSTITRTSFPLTEPLDFDGFAYYVQVQLVGNTAGHPTQQTVYSVGLGCVTP